MAVDWTFGGTWPFEPNWFDTTNGRVQYVDHGLRDGRPVVLALGNPTRGYLCRHFIGPLATVRSGSTIPSVNGAWPPGL